MSGDPEYFRIFGLDFEPTTVPPGSGDDVVYLNRIAMNLVKPDPQTMRFTALNTREEAAIGGVLNDFHLQSLHSNLDPVMFRFRTDDEYATVMVVNSFSQV